MSCCQAPTLREKEPCRKNREDAAVGSGTDGGRGDGEGRVGVPERCVMRQGGSGQETTTCATQDDDKPTREGGRDLRPNQALVLCFPCHQGPLTYQTCCRSLTCGMLGQMVSVQTSFGSNGTTQRKAVLSSAALASVSTTQTGQYLPQAVRDEMYSGAS